MLLSYSLLSFWYVAKLLIIVLQFWCKMLRKCLKFVAVEQNQQRLRPVTVSAVKSFPKLYEL